MIRYNGEAAYSILPYSGQRYVHKEHVGQKYYIFQHRNSITKSSSGHDIGPNAFAAIVDSVAATDEYVEWIRQNNCLVCGKSPQVVQIRTLRTTATRRRPWIPLCGCDFLTDPNSYRRVGERQFFARLGCDLKDVIDKFNSAWNDWERELASKQLDS